MILCYSENVTIRNALTNERRPQVLVVVAWVGSTTRKIHAPIIIYLAAWCDKKQLAISFWNCQIYLMSNLK